MDPQPLPAGTLLAERFEVTDVLGRGGFAIAYRAHDLHRNDTVVVKELAPTGTRRDDGLMRLESIGSESSHRLRERFLEEAKVLSRVTLPGVLPVRAAFSERGTAYFATDYLPNCVTLERLLRQEGRMDVSGALDIVFQLLETLEGVHEKGYLHRDIKPSNILVSPKGETFLIDFGAAREWHADAVTHHTVLYTPGYAPPEQLSERARRGPATDIYALCATAYHMLAGGLPTSAAERTAGAPLIPLRSIRPDVDPSVAKAIETGLSLRYADRPPTVEAFRQLLSKEDEEAADNSLLEYDSKLVRLQRFSFERRQCPACGGILEEPRPLKRGVCPVCHRGNVRRRQISQKLCPVCRAGTLRRHANDAMPAACPLCRVGWLEVRRKGILNAQVSVVCAGCGAEFEGSGDQGGLTKHGASASTVEEGSSMRWSEWAALSGRAEEIWRCDGCFAQLDLLADGRWQQIVPKPKRFVSLYPEEWSRVAAGLQPGAGNAECDACGADYYCEGDRLTLLAATEDSFGFAKEHLGRLLDLEDVRWLGVGKESPAAGFVCGSCGTEFDRDSDYLRLVSTPNRRLILHIGEPHKLEDWHRIAQGLPRVNEESVFRHGIGPKVVEAYESGAISFDEDGLIWKGPARRAETGASATLVIEPSQLVFGGLLKKWRAPFDAITGVSHEDQTVWLQLSGEPEPIGFEIDRIELVAHLQSGDHAAVLRAENLARRIEAERGLTQ